MGHLFDFRAPPRKPVIIGKRAPTYTSTPWQNPGAGYPHWPPGTVPENFIS
jgi:hypothetical protein